MAVDAELMLPTPAEQEDVVAAWDEIDRYLIVSSDAHCGGSLDEYREYLPKSFHDEFEAWRATFVDPWAHIPSEKAMGMWGEERRMADMDSEGVSAEILFPNTVPPFFPMNQLYAAVPGTPDDYRRRWAGIQAHNRWLADFCAAQPHRRGGLAQLFLNAPEDAIAEIHWAKEAGLKGVLVPSISPNHPTEPGLWSDKYDEVWRTCAELDIVATFHAGGGTPDFTDSSAAAAVFLTELQFFVRRSLWHLILGGVFERHPDIKVVFTESGSEWIAPILHSLDFIHQYGLQAGSIIDSWVRPAMEQLSLLPSEYFARNCWVGASFMSRPSVAARYDLGVDKLMWGTDYPHDEGTFPYTTQALRHSVRRRARGGVPQDLRAARPARSTASTWMLLPPSPRRSGPRSA